MDETNADSKVVYEQITPREMLIIRSYYQYDDVTEPFEFDYRDQRFMPPKQDEEEVYSQSVRVGAGGSVDFPVGWIERVSMAIVVADKSNQGPVSIHRDGIATGFVIPPSRALVIHHDDFTSLKFKSDHSAKLKVSVFPG